MLIVGDSMADKSEHKRKFYQLPAFMVDDPVYDGISAESLVLYAVLLNRWNLSLKKPEKFSDEYGPFMYFKQEELAQKRRKSVKGIQRCFKELKDYDLLVVNPSGRGKTAKLRLVEQEIPNHEKTDLSVHKAPNLRDKTDLSAREQTDLSAREQTDLSAREQTDLSAPYIEKELHEKELPDKEIQDKEILSSKEREKKEIQPVLPGNSPKGETVGAGNHEVPSLDDIKKYVSEKGFTFNPEQFFNKYAKSDWKTENGKPIHDWKTFAMVYEIQELKGKMNE